MKLLETHKQEILEVFQKAGAVALEEFLRYQRSNELDMVEKSNKEIVTSVDKKIEKVLFDGFREFFPVEMYSEETGYDEFLTSKKPRVIFDPLDGTHNFVFGLPLWGITASFFDEESKAIASVVSVPTEGLILMVGESLELYENGKKISIENDGKKKLKESLVLYDNQIHKIGSSDFLKRFEKLAESSFTTRICGSSSWDIMKIITSNVGARIFGNVELYDLAPAMALNGKHGYSLVPLDREKAFVFGKNESLTSEIKELLC